MFSCHQVELYVTADKWSSGPSIFVPILSTKTATAYWTIDKKNERHQFKLSVKWSSAFQTYLFFMDRAIMDFMDRDYLIAF